MAGVTLVALVTAAAYEAAVALRVLAIGDAPGDGASGAGVVAVIAVVALLAGFVVSLAGDPPWRTAPAVKSFLPLAAASLVVAHGLGFDPYYAPSRIRFPRNSGFPSTWWLGAVALGGMIAAVVAARHARAGGIASASVMLVCLVTFVLTGVGH